MMTKSVPIASALPGLSFHSSNSFCHFPVWNHPDVLHEQIEAHGKLKDSTDKGISTREIDQAALWAKPCFDRHDYELFNVAFSGMSGSCIHDLSP
jgi:hypothetical protein